MSRNRKDISPADAESDTDISLQPGFTYEEMKRDLWGELDLLVGKIPIIQTGDITIEDFAKRYSISMETARHKMYKIAETNNSWEFIEVKNEQNRTIKVLRKKNAV